MESGNTQQPIITNISKSTWSFIFGRYWKKTLLFLFFIVIGVALGMWLNTGIFFTIAIFALIFYIVYVYAKLQTLFFEQFAKQNGYTYQEKGTLDGKHGDLFDKGYNKEVFDDIRGTYLGCAIELFNYEHKVGKSAYTYSIFSIDFQSQVPHISLQKTLPFGADSTPVWGQKVTLEGDFSQRFDLYVQKGFELEALQIFTPDIMSSIEQNWKFGLEFFGTKLYIIRNKFFIGKKDELQSFYDAAKYFASKLESLIAKMKSDIEAVAETELK